jgi:hypothetical protein
MKNSKVWWHTATLFSSLYVSSEKNIILDKDTLQNHFSYRTF